MKIRKHSNEFKVMIVELLQSGQKASQVSAEYDLNESMIRRWRKSHEMKPGTFSNKVFSETPPLDIKSLQKELREVKMERDILKKAVGIFSKSDR